MIIVSPSSNEQTDREEENRMVVSGKSRLHPAHISGQLIEGKYRIMQCLGQGSLSAVYQAQRLSDAAPVTLTMFLLPDSFSDSETSRFMSRFSKVATALMTLSHPSILPTYDYGEYGGHPYLVSGYIEGASLADMLKERGRYTQQEALSVLERIAPALDYAHQRRVIHRALKPANILLSANQLYLAGFGLACMVEMEGISEQSHPSHRFMTIAGTYIGSPEYLAPEVITGQEISARADIYALGMILFEMLTGRPPFTGEDFLQIARAPLSQPFPSVLGSLGLPSTLDALFHRATNYLPELRFERAEDLVAAYVTAAGSSLAHSHQGKEHNSMMPIIKPEQLAISEQRTPAPNPDALAEPWVESGNSQALEKRAHRTVGLSELCEAPWIEGGMPCQDTSSSQEVRTILQTSPGDIAAGIEQLLASALVAQTASFSDVQAPALSQVSTERVVALTHSTSAPERKRMTMLFAVNIEATVGVLSRLFGGNTNNEPETPREFVRQQAFSTRAGNFPAKQGAFALRQDTFPMSRDHTERTTNTIVDTIPAGRSDDLPCLTSGTL